MKKAAGGAIRLRVNIRSDPLNLLVNTSVGIVVFFDGLSNALRDHM